MIDKSDWKDYDFEEIRQIVYRAYQSRPQKVKKREFLVHINPWYWINLILAKFTWKYTTRFGGDWAK